MKLSIILPVYNVEQYLSECISSIIMQDIDSSLYEVIIVNDGSPDNSLEIAERFQEIFPNIKIINQQNSGIASARNTGIKAANGDYLLMLDSDDFYSKVFFRDIFNFIKNNNNPDIVIFDYNFYFMKNNRHKRVKRGFVPSDFVGLTGPEVLEMILEKDLMYSWYAWPFLVKTDLIKSNDLYFIKNRNYEDMMWTPVVFCLAKSIAYYDKAVLEYRQQRDGQITGTIRYKNIVDPIYAPQIVDELLKKYNIVLNENTKNKLNCNIANKYFVAFVYGGLLSRNERNQLVSVLKSHKHLQEYTSSKLSKYVNVFANTLGIKNTLYLFSVLFPFYRKMKGK